MNKFLCTQNVELKNVKETFQFSDKNAEFLPLLLDSDRRSLLIIFILSRVNIKIKFICLCHTFFLSHYKFHSSMLFI